MAAMTTSLTVPPSADLISEGADEVPEVGEVVHAQPAGEGGAGHERQAPDAVHRIDDGVRERARDELQVAGLRGRPPGRDPGRRRVSLTVQQDGQEIGAGHPVHHAVVDLGEERPAAVLQALDHPQLPERLAPVQLLGEHPAGQVAQLLGAARLGHRGVAYVVQDLEVGVVHPHRTTQLQRDEAHPLPVAGNEPEVRRHGAHELAVRRRRSLEDADVADVHGVPVVLDGQEHGVLWTHPVHLAQSKNVT
jgi:hypothetical protein